MRNFSCREVIKANGERVETIEVQIIVANDKVAMFKPVWDKLIKVLDIGAIRIPPEITSNRDKCSCFYCRYFPGTPEEYENAREAI